MEKVGSAERAVFAGREVDAIDSPTVEQLNAWVMVALTGGLKEVKLFRNPPEGWTPSDPRVAWMETEIPGVWGMLG